MAADGVRVQNTMNNKNGLRYIAYTRKSTVGEDRQMLSLEFGMAKKSSDDNGDAVKRGIRTKNNIGWYPSRAPLGYLNSMLAQGKGQNYIFNDPERFQQVRDMWQMMLTGRYTPPQILEIVTKEWKFKTRENKPIARSMMYKIFKNPFYCGYYEYPKRSDEWYEGKHEAMVTKEEFQRVQALLGNKERPRPLARRFAYTGIMECGNCGAAITAYEVVRKHDNGNVHHYVYYSCTKHIDPKCPEKTVELKELTRQADLIIRGITISDGFKNWAIKYLHEVRKEEAKTQESVVASKQKRVLEITKQIDALLLRYTSPANAAGDLIGDAEFKQMKNTMLNELPRSKLARYQNKTNWSVCSLSYSF